VLFALAAAAAATRAFSFGDAAALIKFWELVIETSEAISGASGKTLTPCLFMLVFGETGKVNQSTLGTMSCCS